jgi:hypothetical protein
MTQLKTKITSNNTVINANHYFATPIQTILLPLAGKNNTIGSLGVNIADPIPQDWTSYPIINPFPYFHCIH